MRAALRERLRASAFGDTLLGFESRELEDGYQVEQARAAWKADAAFDLSYALATPVLAYSLWASGLSSRGAVWLYTLSCIATVCCRRALSLWRVMTPCKARWRLRVIVAMRLHTLLVSYLIDDALEGPNVRAPRAGLLAALRSVANLSRVLVLLIQALGMRLPLPLHLLMQLPTAAVLLPINRRLCSAASQPVQEASLQLAHLLTRTVAAGLLLPPPPQQPLPREAACSAVTSFFFWLLGVLLPTAVLLYSETQARMEHRWEAGAKQRPRLSKQAARGQLSKEASLAAFPLLVWGLALPAAGLLWNLLLHVHNLHSVR